MNSLVYLATLFASLGGSTASLQDKVSDNSTAWSSPVLVARPLSTIDFNGSLGLLLRKNWIGLSSWEGWAATPWLRVRVGPIGGARTGAALDASWIPFHSWIRPTLTVEAGHCSGGDVASMVRILTRKVSFDPALMRRFNYDYEAAYLGAELTTRRLEISINFGITRAQTNNQSIQSALEGWVANAPRGPEPINAAQVAPAAKLALLIRL